MLQRLTERNEWKFFAFRKASPGLATAWWIVLFVERSPASRVCDRDGSAVAAVQEGSLWLGRLRLRE